MNGYGVLYPFFYKASIEIIEISSIKRNIAANQKPGGDSSTRLYSPISGYLQFAILLYLSPDDGQAVHAELARAEVDTEAEARSAI